MAVPPGKVWRRGRCGYNGQRTEWRQYPDGRWVKRDGVHGVGVSALVDYLFKLARVWLEEMKAGRALKLHEWRIRIEELVPRKRREKR